MLKRFVIVLSVVLSAIVVASVLPGCGSGSQRTLFIIAQGTSTVGSFQIGGGGALTLNSTNFGTGADPQAILTDSQRRYAFVLNNAGLGLQGGVFQYTIDRSKGTLAVVQAPNASSNITGPVSPVFTGRVPVAMAIDPKDNFVFVANSVDSTISVFSLDQTDGALTEVTGSPFTTGATPVSLVARGSTLFVANQGAGTVSSYAFDSKGALTLNGTPAAVGSNTTAIQADSGGSVVFVADGTANTVTALSASASGLTATSNSATVGTAPSNLYVDPSNHLYVANSGSNNVSAFTIGSGGALTPISGSPYSVGNAPSFITSNSGGSILFVANKGSANVSSFQIGGGGSLTAASGSPYAASGFSGPNGLASTD